MVSPAEITVPGPKGSVRMPWLLLGLPAAAVVFGAVYFRDFVFTHVPVSFGGYRRGYGDTVLKYSNRSYEAVSFCRG